MGPVRNMLWKWEREFKSVPQLLNPPFIIYWQTSRTKFFFCKCEIVALVTFLFFSFLKSLTLKIVLSNCEFNNFGQVTIAGGSDSTLFNGFGAAFSDTNPRWTSEPDDCSAARSERDDSLKDTASDGLLDGLAICFGLEFAGSGSGIANLKLFCLIRLKLSDLSEFSLFL